LGIEHLDDVLHLLVGNVAIVVSVNLPDSPHHLGKLILTGKDVLKLFKSYFIQLPLLSKEDSVIASGIFHIHDLLIGAKAYLLIVFVDILVSLQHQKLSYVEVKLL